eukprot:scaffold12.g8158.t1
MARLLKGVGLGAGLVAAGYGVSVAVQVYQASREEERVQEREVVERAAAAIKEKGVAREQGVVGMLQQEVALHLRGVDQLEMELEQARQRVSEIEGLRTAKLKQMSTATAAVEEAERRLAQLREEVHRHHEAAARAAQAARQAHHVYEERRQLVNPLNHPLIKSALGRAH